MQEAGTITIIFMFIDLKVELTKSNTNKVAPLRRQIFWLTDWTLQFHFLSYYNGDLRAEAGIQ